MLKPKEELLYRARPNLRVGAVDWPLFAIFGGIATGISFARHRRPEPGDALGRAGLDRARPPLLRRLPPPVRPRAADGDGERAAGVRACARARVPAAPRARPGGPGIRRGARHRRRPRSRARRPDHGRLRHRGAARPAARRGPAGRGGAGEPRARRGQGDRRFVRRPRDPAARARAQCRRRDRREAERRAPRSSSSAHRARTSPTASARSSAAPSTTCSRTRRAACS